jgi:hypothetical protein
MAVWSKRRMRLDCCKSGDTEGLSLGTFREGRFKIFPFGPNPCAGPKRLSVETR